MKGPAKKHQWRRPQVERRAGVIPRAGKSPATSRNWEGLSEVTPGWGGEWVEDGAAKAGGWDSAW